PVQGFLGRLVDRTGVTGAHVHVGRHDQGDDGDDRDDGGAHRGQPCAPVVHPQGSPSSAGPARCPSVGTTVRESLALRTRAVRERAPRAEMTTGPWSFRFSQADSPGKTEIAWGTQGMGTGPPPCTEMSRIGAARTGTPHPGTPHPGTPRIGAARTGTQGMVGRRAARSRLLDTPSAF